MSEFEDVGDVLKDILIDSSNIDSAEFRDNLSEYNKSVDDDRNIINIENNGEMTIGNNRFEIKIGENTYTKIPDMQKAMKEYKTSLAQEAQNSVKDINESIGDKVTELTESICGGDCSDPEVTKIHDTLMKQIITEKQNMIPDAKSFVSDPNVIDDFTRDPTKENAVKIVDSVIDKLGISSDEFTKELSSKIEELKDFIKDKANTSTEPIEKSVFEKAVDFFKDNWGKLSILALGTILVELYAEQNENTNSGCFVSTTDANNQTTTCKYLDFTCDSSYKSSGDKCVSTSNYICNTKNDPKCSISDACTGSDNGKISTKCSNTYMQTMVQGNTYDYQAIECDFSCSLGSIVKGISTIISKVIDTGTTIFGDLSSIFKTFIKYFIYIVIGIAILMFLYYFYQYTSGNKESKESKDINIKVSASHDK